MLISKSAFARKMGVSPAAVGKACKSGRLSLIDGWLDEAVATIQWDANRQRMPPVIPQKKHVLAEQPANADEWTIRNCGLWLAFQHEKPDLPALVENWISLATARPADPALVERLVDLLFSIQALIDLASQPELDNNNTNCIT